MNKSKCDMRYIHYSYILVLYRKNKEHTNDARIDKKKSRARSERDDDGFGFTLFLVVVVVVIVVIIIIIVLPPVITPRIKEYYGSELGVARGVRRVEEIVRGA